MAWMASFRALPFIAIYREKWRVHRWLPGLGSLFQPPRNESPKAQPLLPRTSLATDVDS